MSASLVGSEMCIRDRKNTVLNPGLRQVAQISLNSLRGKFGQRCGVDCYDFFRDHFTLIKHSATTIK
eukprot:2263287-Alexandrium_andersonii.AAC.1